MNLTPMYPDYLIKYVSRNFTSPFNHPWHHPARSLPVITQRYRGAERFHQSFPWIFQKCVDVSSSLAPIKRGYPLWRRLPDNSIRVENLGRVIAVVHRTESNSFFVSPAPWSAPGLSSLWLPASAPTCGSLVLRTPHWRRAHQISHWNPSRRKTWWGIRERTWNEMWPLVRMFVTVHSFTLPDLLETDEL